MDRERFKSLVNDPRRTRQEIDQMRRNALDKGEIELAYLAEKALDNRFPGWNRGIRKAGGATPTLASFRGEERRFPMAKEAYVWLMDCFIRAKPEILEGPDWQKEFVAKGRTVNYFDRDLKSLFRDSPHLADDPNNYTILGNGWFADLNLSNAQKFKNLCKFAAIAKFKFKTDWNWEVEGQGYSRLDNILREF